MKLIYKTSISLTHQLMIADWSWNDVINSNLVIGGET